MAYFGRNPKIQALIMDDSVPASAKSPAAGSHKLIVDSGGLLWVKNSAGASVQIAGIGSVNGLTAATQTFATGTSGTDFAISSAGSVHTFNIPSASGTNRGLITTGAQTIAGVKTFSGNIGKGKTAETALDILGDGATTGAIRASTSNGARFLRFWNTTGNNFFDTVRTDSTLASHSGVEFRSIGSDGTRVNIAISGGGNIGMGTDTPFGQTGGGSLTLANPGGGAAELFFQNDAGTTGSQVLRGQFQTSGLIAWAGRNDANSGDGDNPDFMCWDIKNGRFGLGTLTPQDILHVARTGSSGVVAQFSNDGGDTEIMLECDDASGREWRIGSHNNGVFQIYDNDAATARLQINTPGQTLHSDGSVSAPGISFIGDPDTGMYTDAANRLNWACAGVERMILQSAGELTLASAVSVANEYPLSIQRTAATSARYVAFKGSGTTRGWIRRVTSTNDVEFEANCDQRLKRNIKPLAGALEKVNAVKVRTYNQKEDGVECVNLVAQELVKVFPGWVTTTDDGAGDEVPKGVEPWSVGKGRLPLYNTAAIQELLAEHIRLHDRVKTLEGRLN